MSSFEDFFHVSRWGRSKKSEKRNISKFSRMTTGYKVYINSKAKFSGMIKETEKAKNLWYNLLKENWEEMSEDSRQKYEIKSESFREYKKTKLIDFMASKNNDAILETICLWEDLGLNQNTKDKWKTMTKDEKKKYEDLAEEKKKKERLNQKYEELVDESDNELESDELESEDESDNEELNEYLEKCDESDDEYLPESDDEKDKEEGDEERDDKIEEKLDSREVLKILKEEIDTFLTKQGI
jgi:hypothetical protein